MIKEKSNTTLTFEDFKTEVLNDYKIAATSRECDLLGRKEVLTGKAKFGIFGDGKEVPLDLLWQKLSRMVIFVQVTTAIRLL